MDSCISLLNHFGTKTIQFIDYARSKNHLDEVLKTIKAIALATIDNFTVKFQIHSQIIGVLSIIK